MVRLELSVIVTTYQRPYNLRRVLESLTVQTGVTGQFEVLVCDDGSTDETPDVVADMQRRVDFPLGFITHPHDGFQPSRGRNEGAAAARAEYLLFLDGDCIVPPDHLWQHLQHRQAAVARAGYCYWFDQATSQRISPQVVRSGAYTRWRTWRGQWDLRRFSWKSQFYDLIRHPIKPKLYGGNAGVWRSDYERVNGYDERYVGWGCEDDDFRVRLRRAGVRVRPIVQHTHTYHLWHPRDRSAPRRWSDGPNVAYYHRPIRLTRCRHGMRKRPDTDIDIRVLESPPDDAARQLLAKLPGRHGDKPRAEVEIAFLPGNGQRFSGQADCNVAVVLASNPTAAPLVRAADIIVTDDARCCPPSKQRIPLTEFGQLLKRVA